MKKIICFVTILFLGSIFLSGAAAQTDGKRTIAILYFENNSLAQKAEMDPLCKGLTDMLITEFSKISQFQVVERSQLQKLGQEICGSRDWPYH